MLISIEKNNCGFLKVFSFYGVIYQFVNVFSEQKLRVLILTGFYLGASSDVRHINVEKSYFSKSGVF